MWNIKRGVWKRCGKRSADGDKVRRFQIRCGVIVLVLTALVAALDYQGTKIFRGNQLKREQDSSREETLKVTDEDGTEHPFSYEVNAKKFTKEEAREQLQAAMDEIEESMSGENPSLDEVTKDLNFPTYLEERKVEITWKSDMPSVLGSDGKIRKEVKTPVLVEVEASLWCQEEQATFETQVRVCPPVYSGDELFAKKLLEEVEKADQQTDEEDYLILPDEVDGKEIIWQKAGQNRWYLVLVLGGICVAVIPFYVQKKEDEKRQKRKEQMQGDYPLIVCKLAVLVSAGMTVKSAWQKIVEDHGRHVTSGENRYAYEQMEYSLREMKSGVPEVESYENFAERCQVSEYGKLGNLLARNVRKGTKGLGEVLRSEAALALEQRRQRAEKEGEKTGTKLLAPMFVMLCIVLVLVIIPAFLSVYTTM